MKQILRAALVSSLFASSMALAQGLDVNMNIQVDEDGNTTGANIQMQGVGEDGEVQGVNMRTKHQKQMQNTTGRNIKNAGRIEFEGPVDISNVMLVCPKCGEATRVAVQRDEDGAHRVCKNCQATID